MNTKIHKRMMDEAYYMLKTGYTVREIANRFYVSKSTVHKDLHERLKKVDHALYLEVEKILNLQERLKSKGEKNPPIPKERGE